MTITNIKFKSDTLIIRNNQLFMYKTHTINYTSLIYSSIFRGYKVHGVPSQRVTRMGTKSITFEVLLWVEALEVMANNYRRNFHPYPRCKYCEMHIPYPCVQKTCPRIGIWWRGAYINKRRQDLEHIGTVEDILFLLGGQPLFGVRKFKYLGIVLASNLLNFQNYT